MERPVLVLIKPQINAIPKFLFQQIQRRRLCDPQIVAGQNADLDTALQCLLEIFQNHADAGFHQKGYDHIYPFRTLHAALELVIEISIIIQSARHDIGKLYRLFVCHFAPARG